MSVTLHAGEDIVVQISEGLDGRKVGGFDFHAELLVHEGHHIDKAEAVEVHGLFDVGFGLDGLSVNFELVSENLNHLFDHFVFFHCIIFFVRLYYFLFLFSDLQR